MYPGKEKESPKISDELSEKKQTNKQTRHLAKSNKIQLKDKRMT